MTGWETMSLLAAGLFAGGAAFVTVAEHPGRMAAGVEVATAEFAPSYRRAAPWQASLAAVALTGGLSVGWTVGAVLLAAVLVLTMGALFRPSHRLLHLAARDDARALLRRWGALHALRTVLAVAAFVAYLRAA